MIAFKEDDAALVPFLPSPKPFPSWSRNSPPSRALISPPQPPSRLFPAYNPPIAADRDHRSPGRAEQPAMSPFAVVAEAFISLGKNKVRTALSMLGIVIGVASVITMVAMGQGTQHKVEQEIAALGDDWMGIFYWDRGPSGVRQTNSNVRPLETLEDADAIVRECSAVRAATPTNRMRQQVVSPFSNYLSNVEGELPCIFDIRRWKIARGRFFNDQDNDKQAKVCVIGQTPARELFGSIDPVGETIRVNKVPFEIVGLLAPKGRSADGRDYDDTIIFPWNSFQRRVAGAERSQSLICAAKPGVPLAVAKAQVVDLLRARHRLGPNDPDDFRTFDLSESASIKTEASAAFSVLILIIASVSLVVGGVGIMNIMLVSVTERTREIGLRMALGARETSILAQFLVEAILLCAIGGLIGLLAGIGSTELVSRNMNATTIIPGWSLGVAVSFSIAVGVFFGFYPAWRASRLNPIEALRYE